MVVFIDIHSIYTHSFIKNEYGPEDGWGDPISIQDIQNVITNRQDYYTFIASSYSPYQILLNIVKLM